MDSSEDEDEEDALSSDSDDSSGEITQEPVSQNHRMRPEHASARNRKPVEESDEDSSLELGEDDEDDLDDNDF